MDFLDPIKKRHHTIRLNIGNFLMVVLVVMGTLILVFRAYGFDIDRRSGEIIQNALVFVDSAPDAATIKINGSGYKDLTNTRIALPEGSYKLELDKSGYRSWQRQFSVQGGSVERFTYPVLFPEKMVSTEQQLMDSTPLVATESPDRKWVLLGQPEAIDTFTQYDLGSLTNRRPASSTFKLPEGLLSSPAGPQSWEFVEWSSDNRHVLLKHLFSGGQEFIVVDREQPASSININRELSQSSALVTLRDKRFDKLYLYDQTDKSLKTADLKTKVVSPLLGNVLNFKPHGDDVLLYSSARPNDPANVRVFLRSGSETYVLRDVPAGALPPRLDIARFNGHWYAVIGSDGDQKTYIYRDPQDVLKKHDGSKAPVLAVLRSGGPIQALSFSQNTRMIMVSSGQHFSVYDAETQRSYRYDMPDPLDPASKPAWMDGHRLLIRSGGKIIVFDYDGINKQALVSEDVSVPTFFDRDYTALYSVSASAATAGKQAFVRTELRVLPK